MPLHKCCFLVSGTGYKSACQVYPLGVYFAQLDRKKFESYKRVLPHSVQNTPLFIAEDGVVVLLKLPPQANLGCTVLAAKPAAMVSGCHSTVERKIQPPMK
jgi:hypothetical protein